MNILCTPIFIFILMNPIYVTKKCKILNLTSPSPLIKIREITTVDTVHCLVKNVARRCENGFHGPSCQLLHFVQFVILEWDLLQIGEIYQRFENTIS